MNFVHLFFKDVWIGGIIALVVLLSPLIGNSRNARATAFALTAFSRIASVAFGIAGVTGVYVVWLHLKSFSYVLTTDWGKRFAVLSAFAAFLLALRFFAQLYGEPKIVDAIRKSDETRFLRLFSWLGFTLPAEMGIGIAILAVTSLLIITTPPLCPSLQFPALRPEPGSSAVAYRTGFRKRQIPGDRRGSAYENRRRREKYRGHAHEPGRWRRPDRRSGRGEICRRICIWGKSTYSLRTLVGKCCRPKSRSLRCHGIIQLKLSPRK